jgi:hypothetical protein
MALRSSEKHRKTKDFLNFYLFASGLIFCNIFKTSLALGACDKSRKVFEGSQFGVVSHGLTSNYSQVSERSFVRNISLMIVYIA